ncbi:MAG: VOC family protein [Ignavibacteriales bacterium]|nr:VOC family protein [Ignavibacteriales bacterium]
MNASLPETTKISFVHLSVSNLSTALKFYQEGLGFERISESEGIVGLGKSRDGKPFLLLSEDKTALPAVRSTPGLFHVAYVYPNRKELATALKRLYEHRRPFQGFADHGVSEALYLADPEGNGIELYADRPRTEWKYQDGQLQMTTESLDIENLLSELSKDSETEARIHALTKIGHIHLQVSDLSKAERFYHTLIGFDITQRNYPGALFVSAGGYHHHLGFNIWNSRGSTRPKEKALGLVRYGIEVGDAKALSNVGQSLREAGAKVETLKHSVVSVDFDGIEVEFM